MNPLGSSKPQSPQELAQAIASQIEGVNPEHVEQMFAVWNAVQEGDPIGTTRRDVQTGWIYVRVNCNGIPKWRVIDPQDGCANMFDMTSKVVHRIIYRDEGMVEHETEIAAAVQAAIAPEATA